MSTRIGIDPQMASSPLHYVQGRKFQPIQVIEEWSFCHHLGCVVKYVARLGRKNPALDDLKKAVWYLLREIAIKPHPCIPHPRRFPTAWEAIAKDWQLSPSLSQVIFYLTAYQRLFYHLPLVKIVCLKQAHKHLEAEIKVWESLSNQFQQPPFLGKPKSWGTNIIIFNKGGKPCNIQQK